MDRPPAASPAKGGDPFQICNESLPFAGRRAAGGRLGAGGR
jgi:hypothetical protein